MAREQIRIATSMSAGTSKTDVDKNRTHESIRSCSQPSSYETVVIKGKDGTVGVGAGFSAIECGEHATVQSHDAGKVENVIDYKTLHWFKAALSACSL
jgi:hypothetical protein